MNKIYSKNGKDFLRVSKKTWNNYLDIVSPYRNKENNILYYKCGLKNKYMWCDTCNTPIGNWTKSCNFVISSLNLQEYSNIFKNEDDKKDDIYIEIDRNDDKNTV